MKARLLWNPVLVGAFALTAAKAGTDEASAAAVAAETAPLMPQTKARGLSARDAAEEVVAAGTARAKAYVQADAKAAAEASADEDERASEARRKLKRAEKINDAPSTCDLAGSGAKTLLKWAEVTAEAGEERGEGKGAGAGQEASRLELVLDEDALSRLSEIDTQIAVVSVAGPHRTGKSYFLNRFAERVLAASSGASVPEVLPGPFLASATVGGDAGGAGGEVSSRLLPACANPVPGRPGTALLLLDTPGLMAPYRSAVQDAQVMALVEAVSSVVLYNTRAVVGRVDVQALSIATDAAAAVDSLLLSLPEGDGALAAEAQAEAEAEAEVEAEAEAEASGTRRSGVVNRPGLVWLLQQSALETVDNKGDYLSGVLGVGGEGAAKGTFDSFFATMDVARLPYPVTDVGRLQTLDTVPYSDLSDAYRESVREAVDKIAPACVPKEMVISGEKEKAMDGPAFVAFLRRLTRVLNIPVVVGGEPDDPLPTAFLERLEVKELEAIEAACTANWKRFADRSDSPLRAENLKAEQARAVERADRAANPRFPSAADGGGVTASRRSVFVDGLRAITDRAFEELCVKNARYWAGYELMEFDKEVQQLFKSRQPAPGGGAQLEGKRQVGDADGESPKPEKDYSLVLDAFNRRLERWKRELAPDLAESHPAVHAMVAEGGELGVAGFRSLFEQKVESLLRASLDTVRKQARESFDEKMFELRVELDLLRHPLQVEDVRTLSARAEAAASEATLAVQTAVGVAAAADVVAAERWVAEAAEAGAGWIRNAERALGLAHGGVESAEGGGGGNGGGTGDGDGKRDAAVGHADAKGNENGGDNAGDDKGNANADGSDGGEDGGGGDGGVQRLVQTILTQHYEPCVAHVTLESAGGEKALKKCRQAAASEWEKAENMEPMLKGQKAAALNAALSAKEAEHKEWLIQRTFTIFRDKLNEEASRLESPASEEDMDRLRSTAKTLMGPKKQEVALARKEALLSRSEVRDRLQELLNTTLEAIVSRNNNEWRRACLVAAERYAKQASRATSLFSLAPLRFSADGPPFEPARCLEGGFAHGKAMSRLAGARAAYQRGTWGRRFLVRLILWAGALMSLVAAALLAAGRRLQHRTVATAFLVAAGFHFVVLCLSVSEGLRFGTRAWLLASGGVLAYTASGAAPAIRGKRGRRPSRAIWSTAGRKVSNSSGAVMPLFVGGDSGGGGNRRGGGGLGGWGRHKE